jgi:hypothetical protein
MTLNPTKIPVTTRNYLGKSQFNDPYFYGKMDEIRMWNTVRDSAQISDNFKTRFPNDYPGMIANFHFDEGQGIYAYDGSLSAATDTLINGTAWEIPSSSPSGSFASYLWSTGETTPSINVSQSGSYSVILTDSFSCTTTSSTGVIIGVNEPTITKVDSTACGPTKLSVSGSALVFDGVNDHVALTNNLSSNPDFTFEAWVYLNENRFFQRIIDFGTSTLPGEKTGEYFFLTTSVEETGIPRFAISLAGADGEEQINTNVQFPINKWTHIAVTISGTTKVGKMFMDGVEIGANYNMTLNPTILPTTTKNYLGKSQFPDDPFFYGKMDEIRFWNYARTKQEIESSLTTRFPNNFPGLISYYKFDEGSDSSSYDAGVNSSVANLKNGTSWELPSTSPSGSFVSYLWSTGSTISSTQVTTPGTYSVLVTDLDGCTSNPTVVVNTLPVPNAGTASNDTTICNGSSATVRISGYTGTKIKWQYSTDNITFTDLAIGDTLSNYNTGSLSDTTYFRSYVGNGLCDADTSGVITVSTQVCTEFDASITINSPHAGVYSDTVWVRAHLIDAYTKQPVEGKTVEFRIYDGNNPSIGTADVNSPVAITDAKGFARSYILLTQDPDWTDDFDDKNKDTMNIRAYFAGDEGYTSAERVENFNARKETADFVSFTLDPDCVSCTDVPNADKIKFNGKTGSGYIKTNNSTVDVTIQVQIKEQNDGMPGDLTKANVRFELNPSGGSTPLIQYVRPGSDGLVSATFNGLSVGSYGSNSFTVHITAGDYYKGRLNSTLTIHKNGVSSLFSGGGDILTGSGTGKYTPDAGSISSFTVGSKYNTKATNVQGKASLIFTSKGRTYEVTGSGTPSVTFDSTGGVASYSSSASMMDVTLDTLTGNSVPTTVSSSKLKLSVNMKDSATDMIAINLTDGSTVWYTNSGSGSSADRQQLVGGGMTILANIAAPVAVPVARCGSGIVTMSATPPSGSTVDWYDAPANGILLLRGSATYTTNVSASGVFYAESRNSTTNALSTSRTPVTVTVNAQPAAPAVTSGARCGAGTLVLSSTIPANTTIAWYSAATGGTALATTSSYTTPNISTTTNYYVESRSTVNGCVSARTVATAMVNTLPSAPVAASGAICTPGSITIGANTTQTNKRIEWYGTSMSSTVINTGSSYTIPNLTATTTYYTVSKDTLTGCASSTRTAVTARLSSNPATPSSITGTVTTCPTTAKSIKFTAATVTGATSYQWTKPDCATGISTTNAITLTFTNANASDMVSVKAVNAYGCQSAAKSVQVTTNTTCKACGATAAGSTKSRISESVVAEDGLIAPQIGVYPNPNKGQFNLSLRGFDAGAAQVRILDVNGSVIYMRQHNLLTGLNILPMKINKSVQGVYMIQVMQKGKVRGVKLLKE